MSTLTQRPSTGYTMSSDAHTVFCFACRGEVHFKATKCPHCHEWVRDTRLNYVDAALRIAGYVWAAFSVLAAVVLARLFMNLEESSAQLGFSVLFSLWYVWVGILGLQGVVTGLWLVSFAERGQRYPTE